MHHRFFFADLPSALPFPSVMYVRRCCRFFWVVLHCTIVVWWQGLMSFIQFKLLYAVAVPSVAQIMMTRHITTFTCHRHHLMTSKSRWKFTCFVLVVYTSGLNTVSPLPLKLWPTALCKLVYYYYCCDYYYYYNYYYVLCKVSKADQYSLQPITWANHWCYFLMAKEWYTFCIKCYSNCCQSKN